MQQPDSQTQEVEDLTIDIPTARDKEYASIFAAIQREIREDYTKKIKEQDDQIKEKGKEIFHLSTHLKEMEAAHTEKLKNIDVQLQEMKTRMDKQLATKDKDFANLVAEQKKINEHFKRQLDVNTTQIQALQAFQLDILRLQLDRFKTDLNQRISRLELNFSTQSHFAFSYSRETNIEALHAKLTALETAYISKFFSTILFILVTMTSFN